MYAARRLLYGTPQAVTSRIDISFGSKRVVQSLKRKRSLDRAVYASDYVWTELLHSVMWRTIAGMMHQMLDRLNEELHPKGAKDHRSIQTERNADRVGYSTTMSKKVRKCECRMLYMILSPTLVLQPCQRICHPLTPVRRAGPVLLSFQHRRQKSCLRAERWRVCGLSQWSYDLSMRLQ